MINRLTRQILPQILSRLNPPSQSTPTAYRTILGGENNNASKSREKIPDATARPTALLELLGKSGGSVRSGGGGGGGCELTPDEASTVCKCAVSLLGHTGDITGGEAGGDPGGEVSVKKEGGVTAAPGLFPLDIDQEVNFRNKTSHARCQTF